MSNNEEKLTAETKKNIGKLVEIAFKLDDSALTRLAYVAEGMALVNTIK